MAIGLGHATRAQVFLEANAAWGTRVITTGTALEVNAVGVNIDEGVVRSKALYAGLSARALYQMGVKWAGKISGEARYEGLAKIFAAGFGDTPTTTGSSTLGYTNTYTIKKTTQGGTASLSMELDEGGVYTGTGDCSIITGMVIPRLRFTVAAGQGDDAILMWEADVWAKDKTPSSTPTFTAGVPAASQTPVFYHHGLPADLQDGTADTPGTQNVTRLSVELVNPLAERYFIAGPNGKNIHAPLRNGQVQVFWDLQQELQNWNQLNAAKNFTDGALKATFVSLDDIPGTSPLLKYRMTLNTTKAKCLSFTSDINEWGIIEARSRWEGYNDTNGALILTALNGKSGVATLGA